MILTVYKSSFDIFLLLEKLKSQNGGITIFEWSWYHIHILENLKVRMVMTPYLSGLNIII